MNLRMVVDLPGVDRPPAGYARRVAESVIARYNDANLADLCPDADVILVAAEWEKEER